MTPNQDESDKSLRAARSVKKKAKSIVEVHAPVQGVGITKVDGVYAVKVMLLREPDKRSDLPSDIDGVPLVIKVTGKIRKQEPED